LVGRAIPRVAIAALDPVSINPVLHLDPYPDACTV
jgi:hypothetical protein